MPVQIDKNIRIPVEGEEGQHTGHKVRVMVLTEAEGAKALYCSNDKKFITYIFAKNKGWDLEKARTWASEHLATIQTLNEISVDQEEEFLKVIAVKKGGATETYIANSPSFILEKEIEAETMGIDDKARGQGQGVGGERQGDGGTDTCICPNCRREKPHTRGVPCNKTICPDCGTPMIGKSEKAEIDIVKIDKKKQIAYGIFLVPEKADYDGDVISEEDIEKVAHDFMVEYRTIDEMHRQVTEADIVESAIAWQDELDYFGKKLKRGTWFGAIHVRNKDVWEKIEQGVYKGFSVRIAGRREPIEKE